MYELATVRLERDTNTGHILPKGNESILKDLLCRELETKTSSAGSQIHMFTMANSGTVPWV